MFRFFCSNSRHRERHAKTLEIAQEEVLTCIGMFIYERLRRVHICLKEEENACQVLAAVAVHALCRSFDMAVEKKRGISNLELLFKEMSRAEKVKDLRKEQKKLKKKKKKNDKKSLEDGGSASRVLCLNCELMDEGQQQSGQCTCAIDENGYDTEEQEAIDSMGSMNNNNNNIMLNKCCNGGGDTDAVKKKGSPSKKTTSMSIVGTNRMCCGAGLANRNNGVGGGGVGDGSVTANGACTVAEELNFSVKDEISDICLCHSCDAVHGSSNSNGIGISGSGSGCSKSIDGGYVSEPSSSNHDGPCSALSSSRTSSIASSPEGSEVACSDGCCNHELGGGVNGSTGHHHHTHYSTSLRATPEYQTCAATGNGDLTLSLQQMLVSFSHYVYKLVL